MSTLLQLIHSPPQKWCTWTAWLSATGIITQVVDEGAGKNEGADELLSAFNVATFKSAEDDKAFWNRLIPADTRTDTDKKVRICLLGNPHLTTGNPLSPLTTGVVQC